MPGIFLILTPIADKLDFLHPYPKIEVNPNDKLNCLEVLPDMKRKKHILWIIIAVSALMLGACQQSEPTQDIDAQKTGFAQTAEVQMTMTAEAQPTSTPTLEPTSTPEPTATVESSVTPEEDETPVEVATATQNSASGNDAAAWLSNDPPDNTVFAPGEEFTVTWTLENTGTSTWNNNYYIEFATDEQMDAEDKYFVPIDVPPNTSVQVSADFIAPDSEGTIRSTWDLVNDNDVAFYRFYVEIEVSETGGEEP